MNDKFPLYMKICLDLHGYNLSILFIVYNFYWSMKDNPQLMRSSHATYGSAGGGIWKFLEILVVSSHAILFGVTFGFYVIFFFYFPYLPMYSTDHLYVV